jgi:hypothetical protein
MPRVIQIISPSWNLFTSFNLWEERIGQISLATMAVLRANDWSAVPPSFLEVQGVQGAEVYIWGDVLEGIKEMAHNVTAALLTLPLGNMRSECSYELAVYQYSPFALWVPYGVSNFSLLSCYNLTFSPLRFIDGRGHCSNFTHCFRHDNGKI